MNDSEEALRQGVRQMAAEWRKTRGEHPSAETLLAYHDDELSEAEARDVREHLSLCRECAETVVDLANFPDVEPRDEAFRLSTEEKEVHWQELLGRIEERGGFEEDLVRTKTSPTTGPPTTRWRPYLMAAVLAVATLGLGWWIAQLQQAPLPGPAPEANLAVIELAPLGVSVLRGEDAHELPESISSLVVLLALPDLQPLEDAAVVVRKQGPEGEVVWRRSGLVRTPTGHFSVRLPREMLPPGTYHLTLTGTTEGDEELLAEYELEIAP